MHNTLFFGIDLSHPNGGRIAGDAEHLDPTTIGFASNMIGGCANCDKGLKLSSSILYITYIYIFR